MLFISCVWVFTDIPLILLCAVCVYLCIRSIGALAGVTSVMLVTLMGQPRILLAMSRDGLLPPRLFGYIHPIYKTPMRGTLITGAFRRWVKTETFIPFSLSLSSAISSVFFFYGVWAFVWVVYALLTPQVFFARFAPLCCP